MANDFVKVYSAESLVTAEMLLNALAQSHIPAFRQGSGGSGYMDIYAGFSVFGEDIYVAAGYEALAREIIEGIMTKVSDTQTPDLEAANAQALTEHGESDKGLETEDSFNGGWWSMGTRTWIARAIIIVLIIGLVASVIIKG